MIKSIHLKNYILTDDITVDFSNGLNVITGETGAGKSILINAIDIVLGGKITSDVINKKEEKAVVELYFSGNIEGLKDLFIQNDLDYYEDENIISREITETSSRTRLNGTVVNKNFINDLRNLILDIHTQNQTYSFIQPKYHVTLLDNYSKDFYGKELSEYREVYTEYKKLEKDLLEAENLANATENQIDFLKFQVNEIEEANIQDIAEEENLKEELNILENAEKLKDLTYSGYWGLNGEEGSAYDIISKVRYNISKAVRLDKNIEEIENKIIEAEELIKETAYELRDYSSSVSDDIERLNEIQERLFLFEKLKRKYGNNLEEIQATYKKLQEELNKIEFSTKNIEEIKNQLSQKYKDLILLSSNISDKRKTQAEKLGKLITEELQKLELQKSVFEIKVKPSEMGLNGIDNVEFYITTNVSKGLEPLANTASGGEISRVMLAIKTIFANADNIPTVIFDEIDTGISGKAAQSVADEIEKLSKNKQIILITHQAIIAAKSTEHILVSKIQEDTTILDVKILNKDEKIKAIANLVSGDMTEHAIEFAKSLIKK